MAKSDWLSIEEISRLWGEETGLDASAFQKDLEQWFAEFVRQTPATPALITGKSTDNTNLLMGMLGARYLERPTFEAYCEERGHPMPRFWPGGRVEGSPRDAPSQSEPAATPPEATPPQPSEERSYVRQASDPELEAFQTQVASMSERLKVPGFEVPSVSQPSAADQMDLGSESRRSGPSPEQDHQELIERAEAASAEARQLKAQLESAEQRLADLTAETEASRASSLARPSAPGPASPNAPQYEPTTAIPTGQQASADYRDPSATRQLLRETTPRRNRRGRIMLATGLAVPLVALLYWGAETVIQPTGTEQAPPTAETANPMAGPGSAVDGKPPAQLETAALSPEPATEKLDLGGAVSQADARDLTAAQHQIARLTASAQASKSLVARLRDELAIARQAGETARQKPTAETDPKAETQQWELALAATASSARVVDLQRELKSTHQQITKLSRVRVAANADASGLQASLQQAEEQTEAIRQELTLEVTASSARLSTLQKELRTAQQRIADLSKAAEAAEDEAAKLREELAAWQQEAAAPRPSTTQRVETTEPGQTQRAVEETAEPEIEELLTAAESSLDPVSGDFEQVAALAPSEGALQTDAVPDTVSLDDLLLCLGTAEISL